MVKNEIHRFFLPESEVFAKEWNWQGMSAQDFVSLINLRPQVTFQCIF